jgi:8-oxo-dGTP pyrophosphatase MutT (NUDIX family)
MSDRGGAAFADALARWEHAALVDRVGRALQGRERRLLHIDGYRPAAVAVLLAERDGETRVPLTVRPLTMRAHSGQIALPGGVRDPADASLAACALREAEEELGIPPSAVHIIGQIDDIFTPSGFVVTPVIAELRAPPRYRPNPAEVAEVFEAPLSLFADPATAEDLGEREHFGVRYTMRAYPWGEHRIWGATARILENLTELVG